MARSSIIAERRAEKARKAEKRAKPAVALRPSQERRRLWWAQFRRRAFVTLLVLLGCMVALTPPIWWLGSPWWTAFQLRAAANSRDPAALIALIDMATFRDNLWIDVRARTFARLAQARGRFVDPAEKAQAEADVREIVLRMTEYEELARLFGGERTADMPLGATALSSASWRIDREGVDRFRLRRADDESGKGDLVFDRFGVNWKLVHMPLARR